MHTAVHQISPIHLDLDIAELKLKPDYAHLQAAVDGMKADPMTAVVKRLVREGMDAKLAQRVRLGYIQFLALIMAGLSPVTPSHLVDKAWHTHIIHTMQYMGFCEKHFGRYIHHTPLEHVLATSKGSTMVGRVFQYWDQDVWGEDAICDDIPGPGDCA